MRMSGQFTTTLDLGEIGEREAIVSWEGYRTATPDVDDYNEMQIMDVRITRGSGPAFDITSWLMSASIDSLKEEAWERFPSKAEIEAERADHQYQEYRDQCAECEA
jgi:hypothetical protein